MRHFSVDSNQKESSLKLFSKISEKNAFLWGKNIIW